MKKQSSFQRALSPSNTLLLTAVAASLLAVSSQPQAALHNSNLHKSNLHNSKIHQGASTSAEREDALASAGRIFKVSDAKGRVTFTDTPVREHQSVKPGLKQLERQNPKFCDAMTFFSQVHCRGKKASTKPGVE